MTPGANPPDGIEPDENSLPTGDEPPETVGAAGIIVGICESELIACPQDEQNRLSVEIGAEHAGH
jgi:hypothetical protein